MVDMISPVIFILLQSETSFHIIMDMSKVSNLVNVSDRVYYTIGLTSIEILLHIREQLWCTILQAIA